MVDAEKRRRVRRAARAWLARRRDLAGLEISFEVVGIRGRHLVRVRDDLTTP
jgi:Holliday junction resolvase-like predicted endonuclease